MHDLMLQCSFVCRLRHAPAERFARNVCKASNEGSPSPVIEHDVVVRIPVAEAMSLRARQAGVDPDQIRT